MRFLSIYTPDENTASLPPSQEHMEEMGKFMEEMENAGVLLATGGFLRSPTSLRVRSSGGEITVIDGAASEATRRIVGFALLEVTSREEAIEVSSRFLRVAGDGESELRQLMDVPPEPVAQD